MRVGTLMGGHVVYDSEYQRWYQLWYVRVEREWVTPTADFLKA